MAAKIFGPYCSRAELESILEMLRGETTQIIGSDAEFVKGVQNQVDLGSVDPSLREAIEETLNNVPEMKHFAFVLLEKDEPRQDYHPTQIMELNSDAEYPRNEYVVDRDANRDPRLEEENLEQGSCDI